MEKHSKKQLMPQNFELRTDRSRILEDVQLNGVALEDQM
jgi:hypothetical protein